MGGGAGRFIAGEAPVWQPRADRQASPHNRDGTSDPYKTLEQQQQRSAVSGSIGTLTYILLNKLLFTESANYADGHRVSSVTESNYASGFRVYLVSESNNANGHRV